MIYLARVETTKELDNFIGLDLDDNNIEVLVEDGAIQALAAVARPLLH